MVSIADGAKKGRAFRHEHRLSIYGEAYTEGSDPLGQSKKNQETLKMKRHAFLLVVAFALTGCYSISYHANEIRGAAYPALFPGTRTAWCYIPDSNALSLARCGRILELAIEATTDALFSPVDLVLCALPVDIKEVGIEDDGALSLALPRRKATLVSKVRQDGVYVKVEVEEGYIGLKGKSALLGPLRPWMWRFESDGLYVGPLGGSDGLGERGTLVGRPRDGGIGFMLCPPFCVPKDPWNEPNYRWGAAYKPSSSSKFESLYFEYGATNGVAKLPFIASTNFVGSVTINYKGESRWYGWRRNN